MNDVTDNINFFKGKAFTLACSLVILAGLVFRFFNIAQSDFVFYDEGYYLNDNRREFVEFIEAIPREQMTLPNIGKALYGNLQVSLGTGKALWLFLNNLRALWGWGEVWFFPRVLSAVFGSLTLMAAYLFALKYLNSRSLAIMSTAILAILPSHVFYSRLAMQEALSTFVFLLGFYFYVFPKRFSVQMFFSAVFFVLAYFSNYRLIIIPVLTAFAEVFLSLSRKEKPDIRHYVWHTVTFIAMVILIAVMDQGQHIKIIAPWMLHQSHLAQGEPFHFYNLLSYPYYTFRLEGVVLGVLFWGNLYLLWKKKFHLLFPFAMVMLQMLIFSFAQEKAARYICVVLPFMAMAVSILCNELVQIKNSRNIRLAVFALAVLLPVSLGFKTVKIVQAKSDYRPAMEDIMKNDRHPKILTSQKWVMNLYTPYYRDIEDLPHSYPVLLKYFSFQYRYLVIDPQAYISWTEDSQKFNLQLADYLGFIDTRVKPVKAYAHFNPELLARFVFEHNENLLRSREFLNSKNEKLHTLRIYDMKECLAAVFAGIQGVRAQDIQSSGDE